MKTRALSSLLLLVAAACVTAPALADPALPSGWVAGNPGIHDAPADPSQANVNPQVLELRQRLSRTSRARAIDVDTLPAISIGKRRSWTDLPRQLPAGSPADVVVLNAGGNAGGTRRLNVVGFAAGVLFVDRTTAFFGRAGVGGVADVCGRGASGRPIKPIRYEAMRRVDSAGTLEFVLGRGFIETSSCRVSIDERWSVRPAKLAGGLILGFRTRCEECAPGSRDMLQVLTPQLSGTFDMIVPLERHVLPLDKGTSRVLNGFASTSSLLSFKPPDWNNFSDRGCKKDELSCSPGVRVEVSRAEDEAKATVLVKPNIEP